MTAHIHVHEHVVQPYTYIIHVHVQFITIWQGDVPLEGSLYSPLSSHAMQLASPLPLEIEYTQVM